MPSDLIIPENFSGHWIDQLKREFRALHDPELWRSPERLKRLLPGCRALLVRNQTRVSADIIDAGRQLLVIGRAGAGFDNIDVSAATAAGIVIASTPDQNSISVAELVLGMMLGLARKLPEASLHTRRGGWERQRFVGTELYQKTLGIVGLGRIGFMLALRARALGMKILAHDVFLSPDSVSVTESGAELVNLNDLLERSDFVSCHVPLTSETRHFLRYEHFCRMKPRAFFLNLARGEAVDEQGLIAALREKRIAGAALDVREQEPPGDGPLGEFDNVILTPHIAAFTHEAQERVIAAVCKDVRSVLNGQTAKNFVNFSKPKLKPSPQASGATLVEQNV
jgi:D-3-phosphoglycerate dehydrogenase